MTTRTVSVGSKCSKHTATGRYREHLPRYRPSKFLERASIQTIPCIRRTASIGPIDSGEGSLRREASPEQTEADSQDLDQQAESAVSCQPSAETHLKTAAAGEHQERRCPYHPYQTLASCQEACLSQVEVAIEQGLMDTIRTTAETDREQRMGHGALETLFYLLSQGLPNDPFSWAFGTQNASATAAIPHLSAPTDGLHGQATSELLTETTAPGDHGIFNDVQSTAKLSLAPTWLKKIRLCYILIILGLVTVIGSLAPALWQSSSNHDLSGGFALAQYVLGVGIFVVGSITAIHSKTCTCWQKRQL